MRMFTLQVYILKMKIPRVAKYICFLLIISCSFSPKNESNQNENEEVKTRREDAWLLLQNHFADKRQNGVRFFAYGSHPEWEWRVKDDGAELKIIGDLMSFSFPLGEDVSSIYHSQFQVVNQTDTLTIEKQKALCKGDLDFEFPYRVEFVLNGERIQGCGTFLNPVVLHDIWGLKSWGSFTANVETTYLEINLQTQEILAVWDCGEARGPMEVLGNHIAIEKIEWLTNSCSEPSFENQFLEHLSAKTHKIVLENRMLYLIHNQDSLGFIKAD